MNDRLTIRDFYNRILGYIDTDKRTKVKTARDFYNHILGTYDPKSNITRDFYGKIIGSGDLTSMLIYEEDKKHSQK